MRQIFLLGFLLALGLWTLGCGDDGGTPDTGPPDGGLDAGFDAGPPPPDGGQDTGTDAGPMGCMTGCDIVEVVAGFAHTCARRENGEVLCWGANEFGELGDGTMRHAGMDCTPAGATETVDCSPRPVSVDLPGAASALAANGAWNTCAIVGSQVYCWGFQDVPDVGTDQLRKRYTPEEAPGYAGVTQLSNTGNFSCGLAADGTVLCTGENDSRQLGLSDIMLRRAPETIPDFADIIDVQTSTGPHGDIACARKTNEVYCWGGNRVGELGDGRFDHGSCGTMIDPYDCSGTPAILDSLTDVAVEQLAMGRRHACAVVDGALRCWGDNSGGQLGLDPASTATSDTPMEIAGITGVAQLTAGNGFTCALLDSGAVSCWGINDEGQLGDGSLSHGDCMYGSDLVDCSFTPVEVMLPSSATFVASGLQHSCAILDSGDVYCWGWNDRRQLGDGTRERRPTPVQVMMLP